MKGDAKSLFEFLDGASYRFFIPVYQRNYDWTTPQCNQLYNDLVQVIKKDRKSHFFGSIVSAHADKGGKSDYTIIDGQQRITTISILLIAMINLLKNKEVTSTNENLTAMIEETYIINKFQSGRKLRLKPMKDACEAYDKLVCNDKNEFIKGSNVTSNYYYFCKRILNKEITIDELYDAIERLEIIDIFVEEDENPQLIFESLNSTGKELTEADKIRNFILMGLKYDKQEAYYEKYWNKIENNVSDVSSFIRHYMIYKQGKIVNKSDIYQKFKFFINEYYEENQTTDCEEILKDILEKSVLYMKIINASFELEKINRVLKRFIQMDITVIYPFLISLFEERNNNTITDDDIIRSLICIESYIFRRTICPGYVTNNLNKIFLSLNSEILSIKSEHDNYADVLIYLLENKTSNSLFPKDEEFIKNIKERPVYEDLAPKTKKYMFERLENGDSAEQVNVIEMMERDQDTLTIEHIMPQKIDDGWKKHIGENWKEIHDTRLHTLANLTLTCYNSEYSNKSFIFKRDCENGFKQSSLTLNNLLKTFDKWTQDEMNIRQDFIIQRALKFWPYPESKFKPKGQTLHETDLLSAENVSDLDFVGYSYNSTKIVKTSSWSKMFVDIVTQLHSENDAPMLKLAAKSKNGAGLYFSDEDKNEDDWLTLSENLYIYKNIKNDQKISVLRKLFDVYEIEQDTLVFYSK